MACPCICSTRCGSPTRTTPCSGDLQLLASSTTGGANFGILLESTTGAGLYKSTAGSVFVTAGGASTLEINNANADTWTVATAVNYNAGTVQFDANTTQTILNGVLVKPVNIYATNVVLGGGSNLAGAGAGLVTFYDKTFGLNVSFTGSAAANVWGATGYDFGNPSITSGQSLISAEPQLIYGL